MSHFLDRNDPGARMQREAARAALALGCNARYRHYKGTVYSVLCMAVNESDLTLLVVYASDDLSQTWCRPLSEWRGTVQHEGRTVPRYERLGDVS